MGPTQFGHLRQAVNRQPGFRLETRIAVKFNNMHGKLDWAEKYWDPYKLCDFKYFTINCGFDKHVAHKLSVDETCVMESQQ